MDIKPDGKFKQTLILIVAGVVLFVALENIKSVGAAIGTVIGLFMPLIIGGAIAFILNVPMRFFEGKFQKLSQKTGSKRLSRMTPGVSLIITLILGITLIIFVSNVIFPNMIASIKSLAEAIKTSSPGWIDYLENKGIDGEVVGEYLGKLDIDSLITRLKDNSGEIMSTVSQAAGNVFSSLANIGLGLIFAIYILLNKKKLGVQSKQLAYAYLKKSWADEACEIASLSYKTFSNFISGQCLEAVILGGMFFVTLTIGRFPYAGAISVIIGVMSIVPFIGAFIGMAFGLLMIAVVSWKQAVAFLVVFFIIQQIEGHVVYPKVVGGSVGLPAIWTLLAVIVGGKVSGVFGIILFIPLFSVLYALLRRNVYDRLKNKKISIHK